MSMQASKPPLNFSFIDKTQNEKGFGEYILAVRAGMDKNYSFIQDIFRNLLKQSVIEG